MNDLTALKILITRPAPQAENLAHTIRAYSGTAIAFPTLEVTAIAQAALLNHIKKIRYHDFVIFLSPHAVFTTADCIRTHYPDWPGQTKVIAMGQGTANTLQQQGLPVDHCPERNFSSEALLQLSPLQNPAQKKILIFQGEGGRGYLGQTLEQQGAQVSTANAYTRQCPRVAEAHIPAPQTVNTLVCTSNTGLKNMIALLEPYWNTTLFDKQLLVISSRMADYASKLSFVKPVLISDNASNAAILKALLTHAIQQDQGGHGHVA